MQSDSEDPQKKIHPVNLYFIFHIVLCILSLIIIDIWSVLSDIPTDQDPIFIQIDLTLDCQ